MKDCIQIVIPTAYFAVVVLFFQFCLGERVHKHVGPAFVFNNLPTGVTLRNLSPSRHQGRSSPTQRLSVVNSQKTHVLDGRTIEGDIKPVNDKLLVLPKVLPTTTAGGLLLPTDVKPRLAVGQVLSASESYFNEHSGVQLPLTASPGDWILYDAADGQEVEYDKQKCLILGSREVLSIIHDKEGIMLPTNMKPVLDMVLVRLWDSKDTTSSGLILSVGDKPDCYNANVVAVGDGAYGAHGERLPVPVKIGDNVRLAPFAYRGGGSRGDKELIFGEEKYVFVRAHDLMAKW